MPPLVTLLTCLALAPASAFHLAASPALRTRSIARCGLLRLDGTDGEPEPITPEQLQSAAEAASEPMSWPSPNAAPAPAPAPTKAEEGGGKFDPRIIIYVSLPALVLIAQLFFTFSRDSLSDAALSPAVMDVWLP